MASVTRTKGGFTVTAYCGDAKTLLAFNLPKADAKDLAGFTIQIAPPGVKPYYQFNELQFEHPGDHAQLATDPAYSSINAPIHKFRWLHVPGAAHQGLDPVFGPYSYIVTPRYFDGKRHLKPLDPALSVSVPVDVAPFKKGKLKLGFTRGFVQSQAFVRHFGSNPVIDPDKGLIFDTSAVAGANDQGQKYTFEQEYQWLGFTARQRVFEILDEALDDAALHLKVFAYDLSEPDFAQRLLKIAAKGRIQMILDDSAEHHKREDEFERLFKKAAKGKAAILRGKFARYSHDKVLVVSRQGADGKLSALKVLTGSTNFSVTGLYVNSNHVLVFEDRTVAALYANVFDEAWRDSVKAPAFRKSAYATQAFKLDSSGAKGDVTFAPHDEAFATTLLDALVTSIQNEQALGKKQGNVFFAVMQIGGKSSGPVCPALRTVHQNQKIFSFGISDTPGGIQLYEPKRRTGILVTGKPASSQLPKPFSQVPGIKNHQVHHKFVVCGFNRPDGVVYCGSSNLALGGEQANGDNLLAIRDPDVVTAFTIEAVALVDHFQFLNRAASGPKAKKGAKPMASKQVAAVKSGWFLGTTDKWTQPYFDPQDLRFADRELFA
jgi:phosphatidylserine/phosphatidylglycerophosphate/cardiolipin synthase-like enzyme